MSRPDYRPFLPSPAQSKIAGPTARAHAEVRRQSPRGKELFALWESKVAEPFKGITTDGAAMPRRFTLAPNGARVASMVEAATALLGQMSRAQRDTACFAADSTHWRRWQNTELYLEDYGLRLEKLSETMREAVLAILRASLSTQGYQMSRDVMRLNRFLGDLVGCPAVLGEWSYIFCMFG